MDQDKVFTDIVRTNDQLYRRITAKDDSYAAPGEDVDLLATEAIDLQTIFRTNGSNSFDAMMVPDTIAMYQYDAIGNLILDREEGVRISWTHYGKVRQVRTHYDSLIVSYRYDGTGNRIAKKVEKLDTILHTTITLYIRDASGNVMTVYRDSLLEEQTIYGSSRLGLYQGGRAIAQRNLGHKRYELSNHLGNALTTITDNIGMLHDSAWAKVVSTSDYYPFGLSMAERSYSDSTYRYGFNGKEKDGGFGNVAYDYGFRIYNPAIGRFLSVDPLTKSYPMLTPYQFASNRPIDGIDLDGMEYLDHKEAKVEMISGTVFIKIENFSNIYQNEFRRDNPNYGLIYKLDDGTAYGEGMLEVIIKPSISESSAVSLYKSEPGHDPTTVTLEGANRQAKRYNKKYGAPKLRMINGVPKSAAAFTFLLNAVQFSFEFYINKTLRDDQDDLIRQVKDRSYFDLLEGDWNYTEAPLNKALRNVKEGIDEGVIPEEYQNVDDLSTITNIVLFGGDGNEPEELRKIGEKIIEKYVDPIKNEEKDN